MESKIRTRDVLIALLDAPSTAFDLAELLGMNRRDVNSALFVLQTSRRVMTTRGVPHPDWSCGLKTLKLYELTPRGRLYARQFKERQQKGNAYVRVRKRRNVSGGYVAGH